MPKAKRASKRAAAKSAKTARPARAAKSARTGKDPDAVAAADPLATASADAGKAADEVRKLAQQDTAVGGNVLGHDLVGPAGVWEDHEGGETDSLARAGVRSPVPDPDDAPEEVIRPLSIRERQTHVPNPAPLSARNPVVAEIAADAKEDGKVMRVIALSLGFYNHRRRRPGDVFDYVMGPDETVLPTWMAAADKSTKTRQPGQDIDGERIRVTTTAVATSTVPADLGRSGNAGMAGRRAALAAGTATERTLRTRTSAAKTAAKRGSVI